MFNPKAIIYIQEKDLTYRKFSTFLSFNIEYNIETLTNTGTIIIPKIDNIVINQKIIIYSSLNSKSINIFRGYITFVKSLENDNLELTIEDEMYHLKKMKTVKYSFPSPIQPDTFANYGGIVKKGFFTNQEMKLHHLLYYVFSFNEYKDTPIYCYNLKIGKLKLNDFLLPSEIIKLMTEKFGFYAYFKLVNNQSVLLIGNKYWDNTKAIDIKSLVNSPIDSPSEVYPFANNIDIYQFAYPYKKGYNHVVSHNLEYVNLDQDELIVTVKSVQTKNSEVITYTYPENKVYYENELLRKLNNEIILQAEELKQINSKLSKENKDEVNAKKLIDEFNKKNIIYQERKDEIEAKDYLALSKEGMNYINIDIPDMSLEDCKKLAYEKYQNVKKEGFQGTFTTYGHPFIQPGDVVYISLYDKNYTYYVDKVTQSFDDSGYFQTITLGNEYILPIVTKLTK